MGNNIIKRIREEILLALDAERRTVKKKLGALGEMLDVVLLRGKKLVSEPGVYVYSFYCDLELHLDEGLEILIETPGFSSSGEILEHDTDSGDIFLVLRDDVGRHPNEAVMRFDSTFLLDLLKKKIETITNLALGQTDVLTSFDVAGENISLALRLLQGDAEAGRPVLIERSGLSEAQKKSIEFALGQTVAYLWGPPGTGKTRTVAHLVHELAKRSEHVMLCAHTNTATDNALLQTLDVADWSEGSIVRVGYCSEKVQRRGVDLDFLVDRKIHRTYPDITYRINLLGQKLKSLQVDFPGSGSMGDIPIGRRLRIILEIMKGVEDKDTTDLRRELSWLKQIIESLEIELLSNARVVATTLTRLYTSRLVGKIMCDTMVIDEAGIASLTVSMVAGCKAKKRVVAVGDFMQLPAIVQSDDSHARNWLGKSVFESANCHHPEKEHALRTMLYEQWRMHPGISKIVSSIFYANKLKNAPLVVKTAIKKHAVLILDTSHTNARSQLMRTGSKINKIHCEIVSKIISMAVDEEIAVIAPYRAQVRNLREVIRVGSSEAIKQGSLEVFTVHRFQGRDKQTVILDLVEAPGTKCGFLDEIKNPAAEKLINVAMSRAKQKLILIANLDYLSFSLGRDALINRVMAQARMSGATEVDAGSDEGLRDCRAFMRGEL